MGMDRCTEKIQLLDVQSLAVLQTLEVSNGSSSVRDDWLIIALLIALHLDVWRRDSVRGALTIDKEVISGTHEASEKNLLIEAAHR
jgi:hypothetical protein